MSRTAEELSNYYPYDNPLDWNEAPSPRRRACLPPSKPPKPKLETGVCPLTITVNGEIIPVKTNIPVHSEPKNTKTTQLSKPTEKQPLYLTEIQKQTVGVTKEIAKKKGCPATRQELADELGISYEAARQRIVEIKKKGFKIQMLETKPQLTKIREQTIKTANRLTEEKGRPPTRKELADEMEIPLPTLNSRIGRAKKKGVDIQTESTPDPETGLIFEETNTIETANRLTKEKGRPPTRKELADELGLSYGGIRGRIGRMWKKGIRIQISEEAR